MFNRLIRNEINELNDMSLKRGSVMRSSTVPLQSYLAGNNTLILLLLSFMLINVKKVMTTHYFTLPLYFTSSLIYNTVIERKKVGPINWW